MHMPLSSVSERDLLALVENKVAEAKYIEYKEALSGNSDGSKKEFLADVTSFANASGGDIIFGIREEDGVPIELCGLEKIKPDREIARLENIVRDGISPRIVGKDIRAIELQNGTAAMILRVPRGWALPHMVVFQRDFRF
ncbi:MAG: AlbA family DNA-binding domain-containing protein [Actinomycetota bacterium]